MTGRPDRARRSSPLVNVIEKTGGGTPDRAGGATWDAMQSAMCNAEEDRTGVLNWDGAGESTRDWGAELCSVLTARRQ